MLKVCLIAMCLFVPCACCRIELRTQEAERGMNSAEAEKLVWAAQTIFATGCELHLCSLFPLMQLAFVMTCWIMRSPSARLIL